MPEIKTAPAILQKQMDPSALLRSESVEVSLLIDYLRSLEHEQTINPDIDASEKIQLLQKTILGLLKHKEAEKIFAEENNLKFF